MLYISGGIRESIHMNKNQWIVSGPHILENPTTMTNTDLIDTLCGRASNGKGRYPHSHAFASALLSQTILAYAKSICPGANLERVARIESNYVLFTDNKGRKVAAPYIAFNRSHIGFKSFIRERVKGKGFNWLGNGQAGKNAVEIAFYGEDLALENALGDE